MIVINNKNKEIVEKVENFLKENEIHYDKSDNAWSYICEEEVNIYISNMDCDEDTKDILVDYQQDIEKMAANKLYNCSFTSEQFMESVIEYVDEAIGKYSALTEA